MKRMEWGALPDGGTARLYMLESDRLRATVSDFGATLVELEAPNVDGEWASVVLRHATPALYAQKGGCLGATVGRYANRIAGAQFTLNGMEYRLTANEQSGSCLHGGKGFHKRLWAAEERDGEAVAFRLYSPDGEDGFPGNLDVLVTYQVEGDGLTIRYQACSDQDTVVNLTNHAYFNLNGAGPVNDHTLCLAAEAYTPVSDQLLPTGEVRGVAGTVFDFRRPRPLGTDPFDHNFVLTAGEGAKAVLCSERAGRQLRLYTDMPGVQLYTADGLRGEAHGSRWGVCLEPQFFPDTPNQPTFPSCRLRAGETYDHYIRLVCTPLERA